MSDLTVACGDLQVSFPAPKVIGPMSEREIDNVRQLEALSLAQPQVPIMTDHVIHGGMYCRTVFIPAGVMITGALIKVATILIVHGNAVVYIDGGPMEVTGYNVVPASAGRKQAFVAREDTWLTMVFPSKAKDVDEAEREFTDENDLLASHFDPALNRVTITGE